MRFQRRFWAVERAGWLLLAAIAVIGLTGALGNGPLSWQHASGGVLSVSYERFQRATRAAAFVFDVPQVSADEWSLRLSAPFQRNFEFTSIQPPPLRSRAGPDGIELTFAARPGANSRIVIWAHSRAYGITRIAAAANGGAPASFWVFIYP
jgi:hypothetical protein